jgi:hypothetical protein
MSPAAGDFVQRCRDCIRAIGQLTISRSWTIDSCPTFIAQFPRQSSGAARLRTYNQPWQSRPRDSPRFSLRRTPGGRRSTVNGRLGRQWRATRRREVRAGVKSRHSPASGHPRLLSNLSRADAGLWHSPSEGGGIESGRRNCGGRGRLQMQLRTT